MHGNDVGDYWAKALEKLNKRTLIVISMHIEISRLMPKTGSHMQIHCSQFPIIKK